MPLPAALHAVQVPGSSQGRSLDVDAKDVLDKLLQCKQAAEVVGDLEKWDPAQAGKRSG